MWKKAVGVLLAASTFAALFYYGMTHAGAEEAMPRFEYVGDDSAPIVIGVVIDEQLAACKDEKVATNVATLHATRGYGIAVKYFQLQMQLDICGVIEGPMFPYKVVPTGNQIRTY